VSSPLGVRFGHHVEDYEKGCMAADAEKQQG
jgi:hypothetical protein